MKSIFLFTILMLVSLSSAFAQVHCDTANGTQLHSSDEENIGKPFTNASDCEFAAVASNEVYEHIACAPYEDRTSKGYSIYRLSDGKDLGPSVFGDFNDCQFAVMFSFTDAICTPNNGKYSVWIIEENKQFENFEFATLRECIIKTHK